MEQINTPFILHLKPNDASAWSDAEWAETYTEHLKYVFQPNDIASYVIYNIKSAEDHLTKSRAWLRGNST